MNEITMDVEYLYDLRGGEVNHRKAGANPAGNAGDIVRVNFSLGSHLVAAGLAIPVEEEEEDE